MEDSGSTLAHIPIEALENFNETEDDEKALAKASAVYKDAVQELQTQLSHANDRVQFVQKTIADLDACVVKASEIRREQRAEFATLTADSAGGTEVFKLAIDSLNRFCAPQVKFSDKVVGMPVVLQRQVCMVQTVQKAVEVAQLQYTDEVDVLNDLEDNAQTQLDDTRHAESNAVYNSALVKQSTGNQLTQQGFD